MACYSAPKLDLFSVPNKYDELFSSFFSICKYLELQANNRKKGVDDENRETLSNCSRALTALSNYIDDINLACNNLRTTTEYLNYQDSLEPCEYLEIPYNMQLETVQSLKDVYSSVVDCGDGENGLLLNDNIEAADMLIKTVETNISELENFQILQPLCK